MGADESGDVADAPASEQSLAGDEDDYFNRSQFDTGMFQRSVFLFRAASMDASEFPSEFKRGHYGTYLDWAETRTGVNSPVDYLTSAISGMIQPSMGSAPFSGLSADDVAILKRIADSLNSVLEMLAKNRVGFGPARELETIAALGTLIAARANAQTSAGIVYEVSKDVWGGYFAGEASAAFAILALATWEVSLPVAAIGTGLVYFGVDWGFGKSVDIGVDIGQQVYSEVSQSLEQEFYRFQREVEASAQPIFGR